MLVILTIVLLIASFFVRLRYGHAWLVAEYSFIESLGISRDDYDLLKTVLIAVTIVVYIAYRSKLTRHP